jgi:hypothetical protein
MLRAGSLGSVSIEQKNPSHLTTCAMLNKSYSSPEVVELGLLAQLTRDSEDSVRVDYDENTEPATEGLGSFDTCQGSNTADGPGSC